ncbi:RNA polymerase subunit sigma [Microbacterium sp. Marseille-Q6965]|uniref:DUF7882 family protein n=1 Tax=Microbacterium sp. Marseille-Q6965 TaxID=2965072 RepID=UPI0021B8411B|nr:RNA polymerase subunit sigma [Microbacterium sp. Marseille-Q6965]
MGRLFYDGHPVPVMVDDEELAHVRAAVLAKLRHGEGFTLSWAEPHRRVTIWVSPAIEIRFDFDTVTAPRLDSARLARMTDAGASGAITFVAR